jgi:hypothetical protein
LSLHLLDDLDDAARAKALSEFRVSRIHPLFWLFFRIEVIEVAAEEPVKAVGGRQKFLAVAEMVLVELTGG